MNALTEIFEFCSLFSETEGIPQDKRFALEVCVEEIVTNVIKYGYPEDQVGEITIRLDNQSDQLIIQIEDAGVPFDPTKAKEVDIHQDLMDRPIGGLGIHMVKKMMSEVRYERVESRNLLTMILQLT